ncbi:MAG: type II secretion system GspH family protein, partial [Candidatus Brocadiaceae bacterium]|nr:type II secretion system GspH family protein [Candidatus Brocadiaceae bacterium]
GFSLIELSIVLVIMGILISFGTGMIAPLTKRVKYTETREVVNAAVESIISFASANNRIPTTSEFQSIVRTPRDAWAKDLYYIPDVNLDDLNAGGVCGRKTTGITVRICTNALCTSYNDISNVAFVIVSGSENYNIQTNNVSGRVTVYQTGTINIDNYTTDMNRPETYDDLIKWITLNELRAKAGCQGSQLKIINNELPYGFQNSQYIATVFADGGVPFGSGGKYKWCRQESASTGLTFNPSTLSANALGLSENLWGQADSLTISGTPTAFGNFTLTVFVRDDNDTSGANDNITQKTLVLTINPASS